MNSAERPHNTLVRINAPEQWKAQPISPEKKSGRNSWGCLAGLTGAMGVLLLLGFGALYLMRHPNLWRTDGQAAIPATGVPGQENTLLESSGLTPISGEMPPTWTPQSAQDNYPETPQATQVFSRLGTSTPYPSAVPFSRSETETAGLEEINPLEYSEVSLALLLEYPGVYTDKKLKIEGQIISFGEVSTLGGLQFGVQIIPLNDGLEEDQFWTPVLVLNLPPDPLFELNKPLRIYALGAENVNNIRVQELYWDAPILLAVSYEIME